MLLLWLSLCHYGSVFRANRLAKMLGYYLKQYRRREKGANCRRASTSLVYMFTVQSSITAHQQSKHEDVCYNCNECDFKATCKDNLKRFKLSQHEGAQYDCDQFDYKATYSSTHKKHLLLINNPNMKVSAMAVTKATLKLHVRVNCKDINHPNMKVSNMAVTKQLCLSPVCLYVHSAEKHNCS